MSETQERVYFEHGQVKVTNARFIVPSQTYAMSGITSVKFFSEDPSKIWGVLALIVALGVAIAGGNFFAVAVLGVIGLVLLSRKATHHVILSSASGETRALQSKDKAFIASVIDGLNQAIIGRG